MGTRAQFGHKNVTKLKCPKTLIKHIHWVTYASFDKKCIIKNICQYTIQIDGKSFSCPWDRNKFTSVFMHSTCFKYVVKIFKGSDIQHDIS